MGTTQETRKKLPLWRDLAVFTAVATFCAFSARGVMQIQTGKTPASAAIAEFSGRGPASQEAAAPRSDERSTAVMELACIGKKTESPGAGPMQKSTEAGLLRITAEICGRVMDLKGINEATGEPLLLLHREKRISSHYFPLVPGINRIVFRWEAGKGSPGTQLILVDRKQSETD